MFRNNAVLLLILIEARGEEPPSGISLLQVRAARLTSHGDVSTNGSLSEQASAAASGATNNTALQDTLDDVWMGSDAASAEVLGDLRASLDMSASASSFMRAADVKIGLQIAGMFDAGNNLLGLLLEKNIGSSLFEAMCPGARGASRYSCHFYKHMPPDDLARVLRTPLLWWDSSRQSTGTLNQDPSKQIVLVALVRSPLAQIAGWEKAPYQMRSNCMQEDGNGVIVQTNKTCTIHSDTASRSRRHQDFHGPADVWNKYTQFYDELAAETRNKVILVEYEQLVLNPEREVRKIMEVLGIEHTATFKMVEDPAKAHGTAHGRDTALEMIREQTYLNGGPLEDEDAQRELCSQLSQATMKRHVIQTKPHRTYAADCAL